MLFRTTAITLAVLLASAASYADTYPRQPGVDAIHYVFRLAIDDSSDRIAGETTVTFKLAERVAEIWLDLASLASGKGMEVSAVTAGGRAITFNHAADRLRIPLPAPARAGEEVQVTVTYAGIPANGLRLIPNIHGERTMFSENWPNRARQWLPMIDHPYDKATGEFIVTAPGHYQVVANGLLMEELDLAGGMRRTHWKQSVPIASWLYALGVARFAVHHYDVVRGIPQQVWVFPQDRDRGYQIFELTGRKAFEFFSDWVGPYSYEKLAHVQAAGLGGGTEHASAIFYGEKGVAGGRAPVVHEVAHQWWGNAVTEKDWDDVWLSEGFATYFTHLYSEQFNGRDAFVRGLRGDVQTILTAQKAAPDQPIIHRNISDMKGVLNRLVYQKGGLGAAHAARHDRHREVLDRDPRLLQPLSQSERLDRRLPAGDGTSRWYRVDLVLRPVAEASRDAGAERRVALRCRREAGAGRARAGPGRRAVPAPARARARRRQRAVTDRAAGVDRGHRPVHVRRRRRAGVGHAGSQHLGADDRAGIRQALKDGPACADSITAVNTVHRGARGARRESHR